MIYVLLMRKRREQCGLQVCPAWLFFFSKRIREGSRRFGVQDCSGKSACEASGGFVVFQAPFFTYDSFLFFRFMFDAD